MVHIEWAGGVGAVADPSKLIDSIIKAPLWFFFAGTIFCGVPMLNIENLVDVGVSSSMKLGPIPLAFLALAFLSLFLSSAVARSWTLVRNLAVTTTRKLAWRARVTRLDRGARAILWLIEEDNELTPYLPPTNHSVEELRDAGFLAPELIDEDWARFRLSIDFEPIFFRYRSHLRHWVKVKQTDGDGARALSREAFRRSRRRV